ncbi:hypothetical protein EV182_005636, partial [Spiromyces aspiralis]
MDIVSDLEVFERTPSLLVLIPVLLNIKGNIEANMSTRLSTLANMGELSQHNKRRKQLLVANMGLLLLQALVISFIVTASSVLLSLISFTGEGEAAGGGKRLLLDWGMGTLLTIASGVTCAFLGSGLIGLVICLIVVLGSTFGINPDNIATPIASGFGDMTSLFMLMASSVLWLKLSSAIIQYMVIGGLAFIGVSLYRFARMNTHVESLIFQGYLPLLYAAITS